MLTLHIADTHLYPGCRAMLERDDGNGDGAAVLVFSDGAMAGGRLLDNRLDVDAYVTVAGTKIPAKVWTIALDGPQMRVIARRP